MGRRRARTLLPARRHQVLAPDLHLRASEHTPDSHLRASDLGARLSLAHTRSHARPAPARIDRTTGSRLRTPGHMPGPRPPDHMAAKAIYPTLRLAPL